jgi:hypothetical protein
VTAKSSANFRRYREVFPSKVLPVVKRSTSICQYALNPAALMLVLESRTRKADL